MTHMDEATELHQIADLMDAHTKAVRDNAAARGKTHRLTADLLYVEGWSQRIRGIADQLAPALPIGSTSGSGSEDVTDRPQGVRRQI